MLALAPSMGPEEVNSRSRRCVAARQGAAVLLLAAVGALLPPGGARATEPPRPVKRYSIRAEVVRLPEKPGGYLTLRHEAVDDFTDMDGAVVGMDSMTMQFPVARGASPDGLAVGDKVEATLVVDWDQGYMLLERVSRLPGGTTLHFGKARPRGSAAEGGGTPGEARP
jgi:Cu/Ag efflux protein CusF